MSSTTRTSRSRRPTAPPLPPRILHLPTRHHRSSRRRLTRAPSSSSSKLEALLDHRERGFRGGGSGGCFPVVLLNSQERRDRAEVEEEEEDGFEADILRAECSALRNEKECAVKELERNRVETERALRSALHTLLSGRKKIYEGQDVKAVLAREIEVLEEKLEDLQKTAVGGCSLMTKCRHVSKKASNLQQRREKLGGLPREKCVKEIRDMAKASFSSEVVHKHEDDNLVLDQSNSNKFTDMEVLRRMEGISKGMCERMEEEYGAMLLSNSDTTNTSAPSSKRFEFPDDSSSLFARPTHQEAAAKKCSGHCKMIVRRIIEQVRAESTQWSEMQDMLGKVREEMDQLKASRDFWEHRALNSNYQIRSLRSTAKEWKRKAITSEAKANELQREVTALTGQLNKLKHGQNKEETEIRNDTELISLGAHIAKEKRELVSRLKGKENCRSSDRAIKKDFSNDDATRTTQMYVHGLVAPNRLPFQNIENSDSPRAKQNNKSIFPV